MSEARENRQSRLVSRLAKRKKKKKVKKDEFDLPGVKRLVLSELAQKIIGCLVGENVTGEKPWIFIDKEKVTDNLELHEGSSEFLPLKNELMEFPGKQLLVGYVPDEAKEFDEFYVCYTESAIQNVCDIIDKMKKQQEARLENAINKVIKKWYDLGSEFEMDDSIVRNNRPLLQVEIQSQYPIFPTESQFNIVKAEQRRDGYMELKCLPSLFQNVSRKKIDQYVQVAPMVYTSEAQTTCTYPSNSATQYHYEIENAEDLLKQCQDKILDYTAQHYENLSDVLRVNGAIDLYADDYSHLVTTEEFKSVSGIKEFKEYTSFMEVNICKEKTIADAVWHPMWSGIVAVAYCDAAPTVFRHGPNTTDSVTRAVHSKNRVLIWSCVDGLHPRLYLESTREVYKISFCQFDENVLIGGCKNGQIIIWDIRNKIQKVEELEVLTTAQQKYRSTMNSLMGWMKNIRDFSLVRPAAVSDLRYSHKGAVTGIAWLSPFYEFSKTGNLTEIPEEAERQSLQFITSSEDGTILIWDLLKKPTIQPGGFKIRKLRRLEKKPSALLLDASPYEILHLNLKPIYKVNFQNKNTKKYKWISSCFANYCKMEYQEKSGEKSKKLPLISERVIYEPILNRDEEPPKSILHVGTVEGEYVYLKWDGQDFDSGEVVNSDYAQVSSISRFHDGPVNSVHISKLSDVVLTVGGKVFALWHESFPNRPVLWRRNQQLSTTGEFNTLEPYSFSIKTMNGYMDIWMPFMSSKHPIYSLVYSNSALTTSSIHPLPLKKPIYGAGDKQGNFRLFYMPKLSDSDKIVENSKKFKTFIFREINSKKMYIAWKKAWYENNAEILRKAEEEANEAEAIKKQKEEERKAKEQQEQEEKEVATKTTNYIEAVIEQRRLQETARIRNTIITKKQLDTKELEKRRKPLQKLDEENERKKKKQKQRLKEGEKIFHSTVVSLFPQMVKEKPIPPPDPYAVGDVVDFLEDTYDLYEDCAKSAEQFISKHPFTYTFDWKNVLLSGKQRRRMLDKNFKTAEEETTKSSSTIVINEFESNV